MYRTFTGYGKGRRFGDNVSNPQVAKSYVHRLNEDSDGLHYGSTSRPPDFARPNRTFRIDLKEHVTARPFGYNGQKLPFILHLYADGTSSYKEMSRETGNRI